MRTTPRWPVKSNTFAPTRRLVTVLPAAWANFASHWRQRDRPFIGARPDLPRPMPSDAFNGTLTLPSTSRPPFPLRGSRRSVLLFAIELPRSALATQRSVCGAARLDTPSTTATALAFVATALDAVTLELTAKILMPCAWSTGTVRYILLIPISNAATVPLSTTALMSKGR